jgi:hypothetical protein
MLYGIVRDFIIFHAEFKENIVESAPLETQGLINPHIFSKTNPKKIGEK